MGRVLLGSNAIASSDAKTESRVDCGPSLNARLAPKSGKRNRALSNTGISGGKAVS